MKKEDQAVMFHRSYERFTILTPSFFRSQSILPKNACDFGSTVGALNLTLLSHHHTASFCDSARRRLLNQVDVNRAPVTEVGTNDDFNLEMVQHA
jgi:hypothetical protein